MARNNHLDTPLVCAARAGHVDVFDYLIERAWDQHQSGHPQSPQEAAVSLLKARNSGGATVMHEAIRNGHVSILQRLMSRDSRLAALVDGQGVSPLYLAVVSNRADMVDILIRESSFFRWCEISGKLRGTRWTNCSA
jgi:ankyrin repeat protein